MCWVLKSIEMGWWIFGKWATKKEIILGALSKKYKANHNRRDQVYISNGSLSQFYLLHSIQPRLYSLSIQHKSFIYHIEKLPIQSIYKTTSQIKFNAFTDHPRTYFPLQCISHNSTQNFIIHSIYKNHANNNNYYMHAEAPHKPPKNRKLIRDPTFEASAM